MTFLKIEKREIVFFSIVGSILVSSLCLHFYFLIDNDSIENWLSELIYLDFIRVLIPVSFALVISGIGAKTGLIDADRLPERARKKLFFTGVVILCLLTVYMMLLFLFRYLDLQSWLRLNINHPAFKALTQWPFGEKYRVFFFFRDVLGTIGGLFIFFARAKGRGADGERYSYVWNSKQKALFTLCWVVVISAIVYRISLRDIPNEPNYYEALTMTFVRDIFLLRPIIVAGISLIIVSWLAKIGIINIRQLTPKIRKGLLWAGAIMTLIVVLYIGIFAVYGSGLQFEPTDNWAKSFMMHPIFLTLTAPYFTRATWQEIMDLLMILYVLTATGSLCLFFSFVKPGDEENSKDKADTMETQDC